MQMLRHNPKGILNELSARYVLREKRCQKTQEKGKKLHNWTGLSQQQTTLNNS